MSNQLLLCLQTGLRQDSRVSILIRTRRSNHTANHVTIRHGLLHGLQKHRDDTLAASIPVCSLVEAVAETVWGEEVEVGDEEGAFWSQDDVGPYDKSLFTRPGNKYVSSGTTNDISRGGR
jgi:hypothetical protein